MKGYSRPLSFLSFIALSVALVACSDDSPGRSDTGTNPDSGDASSDVDPGDTSTGDADTGGGNDAEQDPDVVETDLDDDAGGSDLALVDLGVDATGDVEGDAGDEFSLEDPCDALDCGENACLGGACVEPIDADTYLAEAAARDASWISEIQLPSGFGDENADAQDCCFDYTGDEQPDDGLGALLGLLGTFVPGLDVTLAVNQAIVEDQLTLLIDWFELPESDGAVAFGLVFGEHTEDTSAFEAGDFTSLYSSRLAGDEFLVLASSLGPNGPQVQFNTGLRTGDLIEAGPSTFPVRFALPVLGVVEANLLFARVEIDLDADASNAPQTDDVATPNSCVTPPCEHYGHINGMRVGGVIAMDALAATLDAQVVGERDSDGEIIDTSGACACAWGELSDGSDSAIPEDFELVVTEQLGRMLPSCEGDLPNDGSGDDPPAAYSCTLDDPPICASVSLLCTVGIALALAGVPDVDLPGGEEGILDGISVGLYASFTGASIVDP